MKKRILIFGIGLLFILFGWNYYSNHEKITLHGLSMTGNTHFGVFWFDVNRRSFYDMNRITPADIQALTYTRTLDGEWIIFTCHNGLDWKDQGEWAGICRVDENGKNFELLENQGDLDIELDLLGPLAVSPDGQKIAFIAPINNADEEGIFTFDIDTGESALLFSSDLIPFISSISWSPDGNYLALSNYGNVYILALNTLSFESIAVGYSPALAWSPDGKQLAFSGSRQFIIYSMETGEIDQVDIEGGHLCIINSGMSWSPDGEYIIFMHTCGESDSNYGLYRINLKTGKAVRMHRWNTSNHGMQHPIWIP